MIMEYQKVNLLDNTPNQSFKFRTKSWVEIVMIHREHIISIVKLNLRL